MTTSKQQKLRELITKHNPELLELSFGCELKTIFGNVIYVDKYGGTDYKDVDTIAYLEKGELVKRDISEKGFKNFFEIIGHPIELRHLLIALDKIGAFHINTQGTMKDIETGKFIQINLSIPLLDNEEEVLQGLIDILS